VEGFGVAERVLPQPGAPAIRIDILPEDGSGYNRE
jgi:hypothetical protein